MFNQLSKKLAGLIPGTGAHTAIKKRLMEKKLRSLGYSRAQAVALVHDRFKNNLKKS